MALIALTEVRKQAGVDELIRRGRVFLVAQQPDGSWTETTRRSGGES